MLRRIKNGFPDLFTGSKRATQFALSIRSLTAGSLNESTNLED